MLVIRCREGESVSIGDDVQLSILSVVAGRVKLGFTAPASVLVVRKCAELTREQNIGAALTDKISVPGSLTEYLSRQRGERLECVVSVSRIDGENKSPKNAKDRSPNADK